MKEIKNSTAKRNLVNLNIILGSNVGGKEKRQTTLEIADGATVGDVVKELLESSLIQFKEDKKAHDIGELIKSLLILINGKNIRYLGGVNTVVSENDTLSILKPLLGG